MPKNTDWSSNVNNLSSFTSQRVKTSLLDIEYLEWNPGGAKTIVLTHGWPDAPISWQAMASTLAASGMRVLAPTLRGFGGTRFLSPDTLRSGQLAALGRDMVEFVQALKLDRPILVGHDWGGRSVGNAVGLVPDIASHLVLMSIGYGTNHPDQPMTYDQTRRYWYHWFMATPRGEHAVRTDGKQFAREMWENWGPKGWFSEQDYQEVARAFDNPDWPDVVLHSYRHRWGFAASDPIYDPEENALYPAPVITTPTLVIHGAEDYCNHPSVSVGKEHFFSGRYERVLIDGVGHFPHRENPAAVLRAIQQFCA